MKDILAIELINSSGTALRLYGVVANPTIDINDDKTPVYKLYFGIFDSSTLEELMTKMENHISINKYNIYRKVYNSEVCDYEYKLINSFNKKFELVSITNVLQDTMFTDDYYYIEYIEAEE